MDEKFRRAEEEYFVLRGKLEAGRITRAEFEAALKQEMVQDDQGRYWILGLDSGKWYVHDGKDWVRREPGSYTAPLGQSASSAMPTSAPASPTAPNATARKSNRLPIIAAIGCVAIICLAIIGGAAYFVFNPVAPRPTLAAGASSPALATPFLPVITTPTREPVVDTVPTSTSEPTATLPPPTDTPIPLPTATPTPAFPPGFYVIALQTNPPNPVRRQDFFFQVRFLNSTGSAQTYRLIVYIYRPDQSRSMGETPSGSISFAPGISAFEIGWRLGGTGGCEDFIARVASLDDQKRPTLLNKPDGQVFEQPFRVCP